MEQSESGLPTLNSRPRDRFWPDHSRCNPYPDLLYAAARASHDIGAGPITDALSALSGSVQDRPALIFHL